MNNFVFFSPTKFIFGRGVESQTGKEVKAFGGKKVMIVYGGGSVKRSGLLDRVEESLKQEGIAFVELGGVQPNPIDTKVYEGIELARKENVDFMLPVGGGSAIDTAKAIAVGKLYQGDFWNLYEGKDSFSKALPLAVVLTIPAAGSEGSEASVITKVEGGHKRDIASDIIRPRFAIMNPEVTMTLPMNQTAYGITDMMAHIFERYYSNTKNVEVTDRVSEGLLKSIMNEALKIVENPQDYEARANIMWAGTIAHNGLCGVGREEDWVTHRLEHEVSGLKFEVAHGAGLAVLFPAWMTYMAEHHPFKVVQMAERIFDVAPQASDRETALEGIARFRAFLDKIGMPSKLSEFGFKEADVDEMVRKFHEHHGEHVSGCYYDITPEVSRAIYMLGL